MGAAALFLALAWPHYSGSAPTYEEPLHIASGYSYAVSGDYRMTIERQAPLAELAAAWPLLGRGLHFDAAHPAYRPGGEQTFAHAFLFSNTRPAPEIVAAARAVGVLWGLLLLLGFGWWSRRSSADAVPWALGGCVFAPMLLAFAPLAVPAAAAAALIFAAALCAREAAVRGAWGWALAAGFFAGGAACADYLAAGLVLVLLAAGAVDNALAARRPWRRFAVGAVLALAAYGLAVLLVFGFDQLALFCSGAGAAFVQPTGAGVFVGGDPAGVWSYLLFLLVKIPLPVLALMPLGVGSLSRRDAAWLALVPVVWAGAAFFAGLPAGWPRLLPAAPFLLLGAGLGAARLWRMKSPRRWLAPAAAAWLAVGTLLAGPDYLAYCNVLGRNVRGWLVGSARDWGQDLTRLATLLKVEGNPPIFLGYYGTADPARYGLRYIPAAPDIDIVHKGTGENSDDFKKIYLALSATHQAGVYARGEVDYGWLKRRKPLWRVGRSLAVYDLTKSRDGLLKLARLMDALGHHGEATRLRRRASGL